MGFSLFETSNFSGRPVCLYEFAWGETRWRYTSADRDIEFGFEADGVTPITWSAVSISDNGFTQGPSTTEDFEVSIPRSIPLAQLFIGTPPSTSISLTCWRFHRDDPDDEVAVYWVGTVMNVRGKDAASATVVGVPITGRTKRSGLRLCWEHGCPHALYGSDCRVDKELFKTVATITALTGSSVTLDTLGAYPGTQYAGGFLEWQATPEGTMDRRAIESSGGGNVLNLLGTTDRLEVGQEVNIYIGCDLSPQMCRDVFDNLSNFGGFEFMSGKSPFDGDPVF